MTSFYQKGIDFAEEFGVLDKLNRLSESSVDLGFIFTSFAFGTIRSRKHFSNQINEIIALSCVLVKGNDDAIKSHIMLSKNSGMTNEDITEVFIQCIPFCGFDNVLQAMKYIDI